MEEDNLALLSTTLTVVAICNTVSALPASITLWRTGKTDGWPTLFFVIGLCGNLGMGLYGVLVNNSTIMITSGLTILANSYYIMTYLMVSDTKSQALKYLAVGALYIAGLAGGYISYDDSQMDKKLYLIGSASSIVFFLMNASTVLDVIGAVQKKSVSFDFTMFAFGLLNAVLWFLYGFLLQDIFIYGPNIPYLVIGVMKVLLMTIYPVSSTEKKKAE